LDLFGLRNIQPLAAEFVAEIDWRPILVGGIFNSVNPGVEYKKRLATEPPRKMAYFLKDCEIGKARPA